MLGNTDTINKHKLRFGDGGGLVTTVTLGNVFGRDWDESFLNIEGAGPSRNCEHIRILNGHQGMVRILRGGVPSRDVSNEAEG